jgi:hypothetical protein
MKIVKERVYRIEIFDVMLRTKLHFKKNIEVVRDNVRKQIKCKDTGIIDTFYDFKTMKDSQGNGMHLCSMVARDVKKFIKANQSFEFNKYPVSISPQTNIINVKHILSHPNYDAKAIDINSCYWNVAFKLGFISAKTHEHGISNSNWKLARNISIGALAKSLILEEYTNGVLVGVKRKEKDLQIRQINAWIKWSVYDMIAELIKILDNKFYMVFTDCIYVDIENEQIAKDFFTSYGLDFKTKHTFIDEIENGYLKWQYAGDGDKIQSMLITKNNTFDPNKL